jgi:hypothetical protein
MTYISATARAAGAAALSAEKRKHKKYEGVSNQYVSVPFAVEWRHSDPLEMKLWT